MKNNILIFFISFLSTVSFAQKTIEASDLMEDIKKGKTISVNNTTVVGTLDFTFMEETSADLPEKRKWWNNGGDNTIKKRIKNKISFTNVTFEDDVLAYIPTEGSGYTFIANFEDDVIFKNCTFKRKALFKYSKFDGNTSFEGTNFDDENTFKYAKFDNFVSFEATSFSETATFKYTKFLNGVSFNNANFREDLNIKYTKVSGKFDITNMKVAYDINAKYTKINGKSFTKYLVDKN